MEVQMSSKLSLCTYWSCMLRFCCKPTLIAPPPPPPNNKMTYFYFCVYLGSMDDLGLFVERLCGKHAELVTEMVIC